MCLLGCKNSEEVILSDLESVVNINFDGYSDKYDSLIDSLFSDELAAKVKKYFEEGNNKDREIIISNIMEKAENDRFKVVRDEAYRKKVGYIERDGVTSYDDEIYQSYKDGKLDYLKNCQLDSRIKNNQGIFSVGLKDVKTNPEQEEVILNIYGKEYKLDVSEYELLDLYKNREDYRYNILSYAFYTNNTLNVVFESEKGIMELYAKLDNNKQIWSIRRVQ